MHVVVVQTCNIIQNTNSCYACSAKVRQLERMKMPDGEGALHWKYLPGNTVHGIHSAPMMAEVEEDIKLRFQNTRGYPVVPLILSVWRDGVKLTKKSSVYPVCIQFLNVNEYLMRFADLCCIDKLHREYPEDQEDRLCVLNQEHQVRCRL